VHATPSKRFADAAEMQQAWRDAVRVVLERTEVVPWWRRIFGSEDAKPL
jgi:hypothetical protein